MICNICGKDFDEKELNLKKTEDGMEYYTCNHCENEGVVIESNEEYHICMECGHPHTKDEFTGICKFCEQKEKFETVDLTDVEIQLLDTNPSILYVEKFGKDAAQHIVNWKESEEKKKTDIRHKRDRYIDTTFVVGIILGYILLEINISKYINQKSLFVALLIPTILVIITAPVFKKIDRKPRQKPLPIWLTLVIMAILTDIYYIITKLFA